jgi:hypothetical protein
MDATGSLTATRKLQSGVDPEKAEDCYFVTRQNSRGETVIKVWPVYGARSRATVDDFRKSNPLITALWNAMEEALRGSVGSDLVVELPNGDKLIYRNVRHERRKAVDEETGEEYTKSAYTAEVGGRRSIFYGGLIVENIVQAVARHVFAEGMIRVQAAGYNVLFTVHDEAVPEVEPDTDPKEIERLMSITPDWLPGCPIAAEAKLTFRYLK